MRTTLVIDDGLLVSVKKLAAEKGCSVSAIVGEALRGFVSNRERLESRTTFRMPIYDGGGDQIDSQPIEFHGMDGDSEFSEFQ